MHVWSISFHWFYENIHKKTRQTPCKVYDSIINMAYLKKKILIAFLWHCLRFIGIPYIYWKEYMYISQYLWSINISIFISVAMICINIYGCVLFGLVWFGFTESPRNTATKMCGCVGMWNLWFSIPFPFGFVYRQWAQ